MWQVTDCLFTPPPYGGGYGENWINPPSYDGGYGKNLVAADVSRRINPPRYRGGYVGV